MLTKLCLVKAMVFPEVMYVYKSWTIKKAKHQRIDAFELWCWRRLSRVSWTARRSNQPKGNPSWIFIGRTDAEAEALILWPPDGKSKLTGKCWERLRGGREGGDSGWDGWTPSPIQWTWIWANSGRWWRTGKPVMLQSMGSRRVRYDLATEPPQQMALASFYSNRNEIKVPRNQILLQEVWG